MTHLYGARVALYFALSIASVASALWVLLFINTPRDEITLLLGGIAAVATITSLVLFAFAYTYWVPKRYRLINHPEEREIE